MYQYTETGFQEAVHLLTKALELDPGLAAAYSGIAETYYFRLEYGYSDSPDDDRDCGLAAARRAVELDPEEAAASSTLGRIHHLRREHDLAIPQLETALDLNPSLAWGHYGLGASMVFSGRADEALTHLEAAISLSPRDPNMGSFLVRMADAYLFKNNYNEAVAWTRKALQQPNFQWSGYSVLLSALGHLGRIDEAKSILVELYQKRPDFSVEFVKRTHLFNDAEGMGHYIAGPEKAGVS